MVEFDLRTSALHKRTRCAIARFTHYIRLSESNKRFETSTSLTLGSPTPVEPHWWQRWDPFKSSWTSEGMLWIESSSFETTSGQASQVRVEDRGRTPLQVRGHPRPVTFRMAVFWCDPLSVETIKWTRHASGWFQGRSTPNG